MFITVLNQTDEISNTSKSDIETAAKRILNFFRKGIYKDYVNEIEESSEIFQLAYTLSQSSDLRDNLVRVNVIILTDGLYNQKFPKSEPISGYSVNIRVVDIEYLYNVAEKSYIPIELDFKADGYEVPCIESPAKNEDYESYLAIVPGTLLANIYEKFGARLLEQNVRSFLQFGGKINKGIRNTIMKEPEMFLAFNNGISATAESIEIGKSKKNDGLVITKVSNFQIVNGGQTTASIYHTHKKDKAELDNVFVQVKLSIVKNKDKFSEIVSRVAEYANTQNKVSVADLSSNRPYHIDLEKLSRSIYTPYNVRTQIQTVWFYERARGQYKNARVKEGFTPSKQKVFDLKNPKTQVFTKEELAKYINAYQEIKEGSKVLIGPHFVVQGNQKNYLKFIQHNLEKKIDSIYFEDTIAKAILFRAGEKVYGVKPNAIGDMRYITLPYSLALLNLITDNQLDLHKIWKEQNISENIKLVLYKIMIEVESLIKNSAPGGLYGEWAKKEECWLKVKEYNFNFDVTSLKPDLIDKKNKTPRTVFTESDVNKQQIIENNKIVKSIPVEIWREIERWGKESSLLTDSQLNIAFSLGSKIRDKQNLQVTEIEKGLLLIEKVVENAPEILYKIDDILKNEKPLVKTEITLELVKSMVDWERKKKRLKDYEYRLLADIVEGKKELSEINEKYVQKSLDKIRIYGFR